MSIHLGIDIGGTRVKAILIDEQGNEKSREQFDTDDATNGWQGAVRGLIDQMLIGDRRPETIGVSAPGIARPDGSGISWMIGRMDSLMGFDFTAHLGWPQPVPVLNDGLSALLGESWLGAGQDARDVVLLTLGTGVGGAVMADGRLLRGHTGRAGHLGHTTVDATGPPDICNTPGSLEHHLGNCTLAKRTHGQYQDTKTLVADVQSGNASAQQIWHGMIRHLAASVASIINAFDPERIIIGGGIAQCGEPLFGPLCDALDEVEWRPFGGGVQIVPATLGDWAGAVGAARNAMLGGEA